MSNIPSKNQLKLLYNSGLSMMQISRKMKLSHSKIAYWMNKYRIPKRSISEAVYQKQNPKGDPFEIKSINNLSDAFLSGLGLGIYWGEGNKADRNSLRVGTSDPRMIIAFKRFIKHLYQVPECKFGYSLMCFKDSSKTIARTFWSRQLNIKPHKLGKITLIPSMGKGSYRKSSSYGVCTVYVCNTKLKKIIMDQLRQLKYNELLMPR